MKKFDIEAYLDGSLSQEALEAFNQEMHQNPAFAQQVETQRKVSQLLRTHLLREQVTSALSDKYTSGKPRWAWVAGCALLLLMAGYFFILRSKPADVPPAPETLPNTEWKTETPPAVPTQPTQEKETNAPVLEEKKVPRKTQPIAENKPSALLPPDYPSPNVRGQNEENTAWKAMLDKVWYTNFPPANVQFQQPFVEAAQLLAKRNFTNAFVQLEMLERKLPKNDTLHYLKGYCLLEMGEGPDALRYFEELESRQPDWQEQLQWYRGLGLLLSGEPKIALSQFKVIAASSGHPFRLQSQKAIEMLE